MRLRSWRAAQPAGNSQPHPPLAPEHPPRRRRPGGSRRTATALSCHGVQNTRLPHRRSAPKRRRPAFAAAVAEPAAVWRWRRAGVPWGWGARLGGRDAHPRFYIPAVFAARTGRSSAAFSLNGLFNACGHPEQQKTATLQLGARGARRRLVCLIARQRRVPHPSGDGASGAGRRRCQCGFASDLLQGKAGPWRRCIIILSFKLSGTRRSRAAAAAVPAQAASACGAGTAQMRLLPAPPQPASTRRRCPQLPRC